MTDPRHMPQMDGFIAGRRQRLQEAQTGTLAGKNPVPAPIAAQVEHILRLVSRI